MNSFLNKMAEPYRPSNIFTFALSNSIFTCSIEAAIADAL